jgi:spore germination protein YaaH
MKGLIAFLLIVGIFASFAVYKVTSQTKPVLSSHIIQGVEPSKKGVSMMPEKRFIFVPYWTFQTSISNIDTYDQLIYFGVGVDENGIITNDAGYAKVATFIENTPSTKERLLTIRMLNSVTNAEVIKNTKLQDSIIKESLELAQQYDFDGIVLDFEMNAIPFEKVINRITGFYERSSEAYHNKSLKFYVTAYGDTFYRVRPYDMEKIGKASDGVIIMAYDFHKANGTPGPNFPLFGKNIYGYDFAEMIDEFSQSVGVEKLFVTFGLYGYDWSVDKDGKSLGKASSLSLNKIHQNFVTSCDYKDCVITRDKHSLEQNIRYSDEANIRHSIWFEDLESIEKKRAFLAEKGILSHGYWAYSYYEIK